MGATVTGAGGTTGVTRTGAGLGAGIFTGCEVFGAAAGTLVGAELAAGFGASARVAGW